MANQCQPGMPRIDISESMPRRCGQQTTRANHPTETPKQYWRISLYYPFMNHLITELQSRLLKLTFQLLKWLTGFTESSVVQSVAGKSLRFVMVQRFRHLVTFSPEIL
jgi:hypothetical protein